MTAIAPSPSSGRWRERRVVSLWLPGDAPEAGPVRLPDGPAAAPGPRQRCGACGRLLRRYSPSGLGPRCARKLRPPKPPRATVPAPRHDDHVPGQTELPLQDLWSA